MRTAPAPTPQIRSAYGSSRRSRTVARRLVRELRARRHEVPHPHGEQRVLRDRHEVVARDLGELGARLVGLAGERPRADQERSPGRDVRCGEHLDVGSRIVTAQPAQREALQEVRRTDVRVLGRLPDDHRLLHEACGGLELAAEHREHRLVAQHEPREPADRRARDLGVERRQLVVDLRGAAELEQVEHAQQADAHLVLGVRHACEQRVEVREPGLDLAHASAVPRTPSACSARPTARSPGRRSSCRDGAARRAPRRVVRPSPAAATGSTRGATAAGRAPALAPSDRRAPAPPRAPRRVRGPRACVRSGCRSRAPRARTAPRRRGGARSRSRD